MAFYVTIIHRPEMVPEYIQKEAEQGKVEDLTRAADLFRPIHDRTRGVDGFVSLEVSPLLAYDTATTATAAGPTRALVDRRLTTPPGILTSPTMLASVPVSVSSVHAGSSSRPLIRIGPALPKPKMPAPEARTCSADRTSGAVPAAPAEPP